MLALYKAPNKQRVNNACGKHCGVNDLKLQHHRDCNHGVY